jgi:VanZ family protein
MWTTVRFGLSTPQYRGLAVFWTAVILGAFSLPATTLSPVRTLLGVDKLIHAALFGIFGLLWMRVLCPPETERVWTTLRWRGGQLFGVGVLFAGGTEVYQHLMPIRRTGDPYDALADGAGLLVGILLYGLFLRQRARQSAAASAPCDS